MSTDTILEILRHHDNPCAVLERVVPLFEPFELEPVMHYARALFSDAPRLYVSILLAALNAHCEAHTWHVSSSYEALEIHTTTTSWGLSSRGVLHHAALSLVQHLRILPIRAFYHPELLPFQDHDMMILSLPFMYYNHSTDLHIVYRQCYVRGILEALHPHGAELVDLDQYELHKEVAVHFHDCLVVKVPLATFEDHVITLRRVLMGDELLSKSTDTGEIVPGELFLKAVESLKLEVKDVLTWLNLTDEESEGPEGPEGFERYINDEDYADDDDIPF